MVNSGSNLFKKMVTLFTYASQHSSGIFHIVVDGQRRRLSEKMTENIVSRYKQKLFNTFVKEFFDEQ